MQISLEWQSDLAVNSQRQWIHRLALSSMEEVLQDRQFDWTISQNELIDDDMDIQT